MWRTLLRDAIPVLGQLVLSSLAAAGESALRRRSRSRARASEIPDTVKVEKPS